MPRVAHFEIAADDPEKVTSFYASLFGWSVRKWEGPMDYWMFETGKPGDSSVGGAVMRREAAPADIIITMQVDSINDSLQNVKHLGGKIERDKYEIPGVGLHAYCRDPEGNVFGLLESHR